MKAAGRRRRMCVDGAAASALPWSTPRRRRGSSEPSVGSREQILLRALLALAA